MYEAYVKVVAAANTFTSMSVGMGILGHSVACAEEVDFASGDRKGFISQTRLLSSSADAPLLAGPVGLA